MWKVGSSLAFGALALRQPLGQARRMLVLKPHTNLWGRFGYHLHFMGDAAEAQRAWVICLGSRSEEGEVAAIPGLWGSGGTGSSRGGLETPAATFGSIGLLNDFCTYGGNVHTGRM